MNQKIKSSITLLISKYGGISTGTIIVLILTGFSLFIRSIFYLERHLINPGSNLRVDSLLDYLGFPILLVIILFIITVGIVIDAKELPDGVIRVVMKTDGIKSSHNSYKLSILVKERFFIKYLVFYLFGLIILLIGHGLHAGTNYLNLLARENAIDISYPLFYQKIWLLDEVIGHWFLYSGLIIQIFLLGFLNLNLPSKRTISSRERVLLIIGSIFSAILWVPIAVEGEYAWWGILMALILIIYFVKELFKRKSQCLIKDLFGNYLIVFFLIIFLISSILGFISYYIIFGRFIQPSSLLKG
ncbi:MAG: hypothetical protein ACW97X_13575 [Candidatus Hodarchaeales archaeon]|jgi:hypothetical protein